MTAVFSPGYLVTYYLSKRSFECHLKVEFHYYEHATTLNIPVTAFLQPNLALV